MEPAQESKYKSKIASLRSSYLEKMEHFIENDLDEAMETLSEIAADGKDADRIKASTELLSRAENFFKTEATREAADSSNEAIATALPAIIKSLADAFGIEATNLKDVSNSSPTYRISDSPIPYADEDYEDSEAGLADEQMAELSDEQSDTQSDIQSIDISSSDLQSINEEKKQKLKARSDYLSTIGEPDEDP